MPDWLIVWLAQVQGGVMRSLADAMRDGNLSTVGLAFALGALHALTPGHGKAALAAYFMGREASVGKGLRLTLTAALLHVLSGLAAFLVLRFVLNQAVSITGRASPTFAVAGYALVATAGLLTIVQSWRRDAHVRHDGAHALTAGIGLLPCPLTITVLGFAWLQLNGAMIALVIAGLALGIALTIGIVAILAIAARHVTGAAAHSFLPQLERWGRAMQALAGLAMIALALSAMSAAWR